MHLQTHLNEWWNSILVGLIGLYLSLDPFLA